MAVCVIDSDIVTRSSIVRLIKSLDAVAYEFEHGAAFLRELKNIEPRCLICEFQLPDMTGLELVTELRRRSVSVATIFVTSVDDVRAAVSAIRMGALDYMQKPYNPSLLLRRVKQALNAEAG